MRSKLVQCLLMGCCLTACQLQASQVSSSSSPPEQGKIEALQAKFEQEMKAQLAQKALADHSMSEISDIALKASQKVYGAHPQLMKQQVLFDLQQLPTLDTKTLSDYQAKESLDLRDILKAMSSSSNVRPEANDEDYLSLFYGRKPEFIAHAVKNILWTRHLGAKAFGQRAIISQFLPDKVYRMESNDAPQLVVQTFEDDLFVITVQVTESGLLKPLNVEWMQPENAQDKTT
ncbi:hypothetical protein [Acaryochloris sp. IP29b_bin.148]|uniref:hypothetical protein n=1 Tax=Acaryochloris sp. IP29b_bin.148 TaxID=2969218 RepID=UPI00263540D9|nr:hypothetical protein [Acaryochloris sp. IP29b_bin.148]